MKKIEAIIRQEKLEDLKEGLEKKTSFSGMTVSQVLGCGNQKGQISFVRGQKVLTSLLPKVLVSFIVKKEDVEEAIQFITEICHTDEIGDGKIFISSIEEVVRIRTQERGRDAI